MNPRPECSFPECSRPIRVKKLRLCNAHYEQHRKGKPLAPIRNRVSNRVITSNGAECTLCKRVLPIAEFAGGRRPHSQCRICRTMRQHGLTYFDFDRMLMEQDGKCGSCGKASEVWHVDHDHLCHSGRKGCPNCVRAILIVPVTGYQDWKSKPVRTESLKAILYEVLRSLEDSE